MIKIEVVSNVIDERSGKISRGERAGQEYSIRQQECYLHNGHAYPERFMLSLGKDRPAYPPGMYVIAPGSVEVGEYQRLQFAREVVLLRLADEQVSAPAKLASAK